MTARVTLLLLTTLLLSQCASSDPVARLNPAAPLAGSAQQLVNQFWQAGTDSERESSRLALLAAAPQPGTLYEWLQAGPVYSPDVARGQLERSRQDPDGLSFPYVILIPGNYDPRRTYPVEFNLHGGVNRPLRNDGTPWWRSGYDGMRRPDRIVVLPAAWDEAFWWFENQADNVPAILRALKQEYNVDENRVYLTGVSDGGTGAFFFAFFQPTEWAAFLPYIANPGVLANRNGRVSYELFFNNLRGKPLYIVNGENDRLYPASAVQRHIDAMEAAGVEHTFRIIAGGEHNTAWLPDETPAIEAFKAAHTRDPLPDTVGWISNRIDRYNRNHWVLINERSQPGRPGVIQVERKGNNIEVDARFVGRFTLLLSPEEVDFSRPITVRVNGREVFSELVPQSPETLLKWAGRDLDRTMLFTAELTLSVP